MDIDLIMRITAMLDEEKTYKIIKRQLADVQKKLQGQVRFDISMNEKKLKSESENVKKNISDLFRDQNIAVKLDLQKKDLQSNIDKFLKNNTRMTKELNSQFVALKKTIDKVDDTSDLSELEGKLSALKKEAIDTGQMGGQISDLFKSAAQMLSSLDIKGKIINQVKESIEELKGLDTILTEIGKTGNLTKAQLKQLGDSAFETASTYGKKASDYLTEIQKMASSGFTGKQGQAMAEQALLAQTAGNMTAEVANNYILAMNAAYKFNGEAKKLNEVIDGQNSISTRNNISLSNMAAAMTEIGSAASGYHISIEELSAMIGTIGSITHMEGSEIGSSVNSILNNLQNTGSADITDTLNAANVSMTELVNGSEKLRDPISILKELSAVYNQLGENDSLKGDILSSIGGNTQSEELDALLRNMETFDSMLTDYAQGSGSAMETAMMSANSWEGSLNQLSNTWTDTVNNIANSDTIISGINALNSLLEIVNKLTEALGPAGSIVLAGGLFAGFNNVGIFKTIENHLGKTQLSLTKFSKLSNAIKLTFLSESDISALKAYNSEIENNINSTEAIKNTMQSVSKAAIDMANKTNGTTVELNNLSTNSQIGKAALEGLALAGNAIASWALAQVISLIVSGLDSLIHAVDIAKDKLDESSDTYHSTSSELENLNEELLDTTDRMKELETGGISLIEEDEYNKLSAANDELERTIALKKIEKQFSANETAEDAVNLYSKLTKKGQRTPSQEQIDVIKDNNSVDNINKYTISYGKDDLTSLLANYSLLQEAIDKTKSEMSLLSDDTTEEGQKKLKDLNKSLETYEDYLAKTGTYINTSMQNYQKVFDELSVIKNDKGELSQSEQEALDGADNALSLILNTVQAPKNYEALDSDPQRNVISQKLQEKGISTYNADTVTASLTEEELKIVGNIDFNKVDSVESFKQALEAIKHDAENPNNALELPFSDTLSELDAKIKPALESIGNVYKEIFTYDDNGEEIFSLDNIDFDTFTSIKEGLEEIQKAGGEIDISAYENLISVLSDSTSTADEVHDAFNEMASSLFTGLSNVTNANYDLVTSSLESMGITNAQIISFNALTNNVDALKEADFDLLNADESQINSFVNKHVAAEYASQAYDLLCLKQILYNNTPLNTDKDIENILSLAESAGFASDLLAKLSNVKAFWDTAMASGDARAISEANRALHDIKEQIKTELANFSPLAKVSNNASAPVKQATNSTPKETTDPHVTDFDEKYDKLKDLRDRDILNEKQYLDALRALNEKYYKNDKKYTDQYEKYKKEYLDGMLSLHESVISIATKQIDKYISSLEDQKGAAVDSLKEQQDAAKEALEAQKDALEEQIKLIDKQIDAKQAEIDAINEENEAHENTINLEKEQYELERLRNQRTEFTYSGKEKGFVYRTDTGAIRDQEQNVKEAEDKIRIAGIEKEISLLEKQKDALKDQQDAIDEQIDKVDEYYGKIIEDTETYWDGMIQGAENAKSEWEKMGDAIEEAEDKVKLASVGIDPDDPNALLSEETIRNFKEMHDSLMADVYAGNSEMLNALSELENVNLSSLTGYLSDTQEFMEILAEGVDFENLNNSLGSVMDQFSKVAEAAGIMTGSVVGTTGVSVGKNNGTNASPSQGSGNGNISFIDAVAGLEKESVPMLNNVADAFAGGEDSEDSTQSIAGSVEAAKAAIAGSSSGKKSSAEGENSSGEDSGSLMEAMAAQSQAALDEETGIPAQIQKWQELNGVLSGILENLRNIAAIIPLLNPQDGNFSVTSGTTGITQANGGLSHGDKNAMVSEYGQLETIIRRNGTYQITSSPTLTDLNPGDIVLNNSKTLALIRSKRRAASSGVKNLSLASPVLFSSALPELQPRNSVLAQSNAAAASPIFADNHQDNKIDVTIGDIILENVRDTDTLSRQIVMRLPTQIKQELSKRG